MPTPEPEIRKPVMTHAVQPTAERTKQALVGAKLKYSNIQQRDSLEVPTPQSVVPLSPPVTPNHERRHSHVVSVAHSVSKLTTLTFLDPNRFYQAMSESFSASSMEGWYVFTLFSPAFCFLFLFIFFFFCFFLFFVFFLFFLLIFALFLHT